LRGVAGLPVSMVPAAASVEDFTSCAQTLGLCIH